MKSKHPHKLTLLQIDMTTDIIFTSLHPDIQNWMKLNFELSHTEQSGSGASGLVRQHNGLVRKQKGLVWKLHGTRTKGRDQEPKRLVLVSAATFLDSQCWGQIFPHDKQVLYSMYLLPMLYVYVCLWLTRLSQQGNFVLSRCPFAKPYLLNHSCWTIVAEP